MEELRRGFKKTTWVKENKNDPLVLFSQCQEQLVKLNKQLRVYFTEQRQRKIDNVLPSLETLSKEINELKENISYQATPEQTLCERGLLVQNKEKLLERLKGHSNTIEHLKKKLRILNIDNDELIREYQQNKVMIQSHTNREDMQIMMRQSGIHDTSRDSLFTEDGKELIKNKSLPSLFSPNRKQTDLSAERLSLYSQNQSKWGKIDKIMAKIGTLNSDQLAEKLLKLAKHQKGGLKGLMKNYQVSDKIKDFLKENEIREELTHLGGLLRRK